MRTQPATVPAVFESRVFIPQAARVSPLALAALEQGIAADDVKSYLADRAAFLSAPYRLVAVGIELLGSGAEVSPA